MENAINIYVGGSTQRPTSYGPPGNIAVDAVSSLEGSSGMCVQYITRCRVTNHDTNTKSIKVVASSKCIEIYFVPETP